MKDHLVSEADSNGAPASRVTLVVTPRERWGVALKSLESIYAVRSMPFDLVYVDGNSPKSLSAEIAKQAEIHGFRHLKLNRYLSPNEARNVGARECKTPYIVFIDNDVVCSDDWLDWLVRCADETEADVVAPLMCEGIPYHTRVHQAGGAFAEDADHFFSTPYGERPLVDNMFLQGSMVDKVGGELERRPTQTCEFHCVLVRRSIFDRIGELDEEMLATKEHLDFCMSVIHAGGKIMFEPRSIVTYVFPSRAAPLTKEDVPYFLLRWSPIWQLRSLDRMEKKWGVKSDGLIKELRSNAFWRQFEGITKPAARRAPVVGRHQLWLTAYNKVTRPLLSLRVRALVRQYDRLKKAA